MYIMRTSCEDQNLQNTGTEVRIIDNDGAPGRPLPWPGAPRPAPRLAPPGPPAGPPVAEAGQVL